MTTTFDSPMMPNDPGRSRRARAAFTLIELLIVVGVIGLLVGIALVALGGASRSAQKSQCVRLFQTVGQALDAFKTDVGYLPPLLYDPSYPGPPPAMGFNPSDGYCPDFRVPEAIVGPGLPYANLNTLYSDSAMGPSPYRCFSEFSLTVYLAGMGDLDGSGDPNCGATEPDRVYGTSSEIDDGAANIGFRDPGPDKSWGGAMSRGMQAAKRAKSSTGRVFGPYLDPGLLNDSAKLDLRSGLYSLHDPWGQPIRYYRNWPLKNLNGETGLRRVPIELREARHIEAQIASMTNDADLRGEAPLLNAPYALLSAGKPSGFECAGMARPNFGDITINMGMCEPLQPDLSEEFNPSSLPADQQENLLKALESNVRYLP